MTLTKSGENCDSGLLKKAIDLKVAMDEVESKLKPFKAVIKQKRVISDSEAYRDEVTCFGHVTERFAPRRGLPPGGVGPQEGLAMKYP